jgi:ABC-2 type transport system permease protein
MTDARSSSLRRDLGLILWQVRYEQRAFWRNRARAFFSFLFPIVFLVIFASLYEGESLPHHKDIPYNVFFVPGILAYGVITATFVNMAMSTSVLRDEGVFKRIQGTPLPRWVYVTARILSAMLIVTAMVALTLFLGRFAYGVHMRTSTLPGFVIALLVGCACFASLGIGLVRFIKSADAAAPIVYLLVLPLTFVSGVWFTVENTPTWLRVIGEIFPIRALASSFQYAFDPRTGGSGIKGSDLAIMGIWSALGIALMFMFLRKLDRPNT